MNQNKKERLAYFQSLYEHAKKHYLDTLSALDTHQKQYLGSKTLDGAREDASLVRNITYEIIESQLSSEIPSPKVDPSSYSERRNRLSLAIERLCIAKRDKLPFEELNDLDERFTYIYGCSIWFVEWDSTAGRGNEIRVSCISPKNFIPQPGAVKIDDMDYCFLRFLTTKRDISRRFGCSPSQMQELSLEYDAPEVADALTDDDEAVTLVIAFYRDDEGEIGQFIFSGDVTLLDLPHYYRRKVRVCHKCKKNADACECEGEDYELVDDEYEELYVSLCADESGAVREHFQKEAPKDDLSLPTPAKIRVPYYTPHSFPIVIRKNTSREGSLYGQSDCEFLRPQQQAINKVESRILQKLLRAAITPIVPEDASITLNNSVFGQLIKMKPGESASQYGTVDTTPDISQDIAEAERLYLHAKRILGISDAYVGIGDTRNESGYARQLQISQASGRLESKRKMKHTAYAEIDRLIFEHSLAFCDEVQSLSYRDAYGRIHDATFDRYDFIRYDKTLGTYVYEDDFLFSVDQSGAAEGQRERLWKENLENLKSGSLGDTTDPMTLLRYWQYQERAHYPYARDNVEYFTMLVEKRGKERSYGEVQDQKL